MYECIAFILFIIFGKDRKMDSRKKRGGMSTEGEVVLEFQIFRTVEGND